MAIKKNKILVFPGGTEIAQEIYAALKDMKDVELFSVNAPGSNHSQFVFKKNFLVRNVDEVGWIADLNTVIVKNKIDFVYPAYDDVLLRLSENRSKIKANVIVPADDTCIITRSKKTTYELLAEIIPVPKMFKSISQIDKYPVFLKPNKGQGSENTFLCKDANEVKFYLGKFKKSDLLILEYLPGKEFTIDCFSTGKKLLFCSGRERMRIKNGISMSSKIVVNPLWEEYAKKIINKLDLTGAWFFQVKEGAGGELKLLEIAPRIGGTMALSRVKGVNLPLLSIYDHLGKDIEILTNNYEVEIDRALINRYRHNLKYTKVIIDFDDTVIIDGSVNVVAMLFIYQCFNQNKELILITKNGDIYDALKKYKIDKSLFAQILSVNKDEEKVDKLISKNAGDSIFIDDSFSERKKIKEHFGIPVFDCSMIEMLIDYRK